MKTRKTASRLLAWMLAFILCFGCTFSYALTDSPVSRTMVYSVADIADIQTTIYDAVSGGTIELAAGLNNTTTANVLVMAQDEDLSVCVNTSGAVNGYITVSYDNSFTTKAKVLIQKGGVQYLYTISSGTASLPLQLGDGVYTITVYKDTEGTKLKRMTKLTLEVDGLSDETVYTNSIQLADYEGYEDVIDEINKLLVNAKSDEEKVKIIYSYIINNFSYSYEKAESVRYSTDYLPNLRDFMDSKTGICYDYASLFAAVLRSNKIPVKLVNGFPTDTKKYHAWNEVLLDGEWIIIDTTRDASIVRAGQKTDMIKDSSLFNKTKEY